MLVRGLESKLRKSGTGGKIRKFSEVADRLPKVIIFLELRAGSEQAPSDCHKTQITLDKGRFIFIHVLNGCEASLWFELTYASFVIS